MSVEFRANESTAVYNPTHDCYYDDSTSIVDCRFCSFKVGCTLTRRKKA